MQQSRLAAVAAQDHGLGRQALIAERYELGNSPPWPGLLPNGPGMAAAGLKSRNDRSNSRKQTEVIPLRCELGKTGEVQQSVEGGEVDD